MDKKSLNNFYNTTKADLQKVYDNFLNLYNQELEKDYSDSIFLIKRNIKKLSDTLRNLSYVRFDWKEDNINKEDEDHVNTLKNKNKELLSEISSNITQLYKNNEEISTIKTAQKNYGNREILQNNTDCLKLAIKELRLYYINTELEEEIEKKKVDKNMRIRKDLNE